MFNSYSNIIINMVGSKMYFLSISFDELN